ncbi:PD40 domain-containing protein [bacterium]|nr:PD40 domain-containing protein [bacterium]
MLLCWPLQDVQAADTLPGPASAELIGARYPALSPDGSLLVFEYWGDLWSAPAASRYSAAMEPARRLTDHLAFEQTPRISPDGRWVAFVSDRSGNNDIFVMPIEGGPARQITSYSGSENLSGWTPDGRLVYSSRRGLWADDLFVIDPLHSEETGEPLPRQLTMLDHYNSLNGQALPGGGWIYQRGGGRWWRKGYRGTAQSDIWRMDSNGQRSPLTSHKGMDQWPMLSPDGQTCFYVTDESGIDNIWTLNLSSGERRQLTRHEHDGVQWPSISADGKWIAYEFDGRLYRCASSSGESEPLALRMAAETKDNWGIKVSFSNQAADLAASPDGKYAVFTCQGDIWGIKDPKQWEKDEERPDQDLSLAWRLTETDGGRERGLALAPDGRHLAYASDSDGDYDIYLMDLVSRESRKLTEGPADDLVPQFDPSNSDVLFYYSGNRRIVRRDLKSDKENTVAEGRFRQAFGYAGFSVSPDGRYVAYSEEQANWSDEVFIVDALGQQPPVNITRHPENDSGPEWSADGRRLIYRSSRGDESMLMLLDLNPEADIFTTTFLSEEDLKQEKDKKDKSGARDEAKDKNEGDKPAADGAASGAPTDGSEADKKDDAAAGAEKKAEDKDAKKDEEKDEKKPEVKIDFRDIHLRARRISQHRNPGRGMLSADGRFSIYAARNDDRNWAVYSVDNEKGEARKLFDGNWSQAQFVDGGKRLYFNQDGTIKYLKFDNGDGRGMESIATRGELWLDKRLRFAQMYREAWRTLREQFYDPQMHGVDWDKIYLKYQDEIQAAATPEEFGLVFTEVLGELNASHLGISMASKSYDGPSRGTGHLGLEFDPAYSGPGLKVSRLSYQGPADRPGIDIRPGDVLRRVEGREVAPGQVWETLLADKAGQPVQLGFEPRPAESGAAGAAAEAPQPGADGLRSVVLKAWSFDDYRERLYREWELANEARCADASGGRIGYIHIRGMSRGELEKFKREFYSEVFDKDAVIVDVRFNPGGFIHEDLFEILDRNPFGFAQQRDAQKVQQPAGYFGKPLALLINASSGSDAEIFPAGWRKLGLGPVIGIDTAGAVIGTTSFDLIDGTTVRLPVEGWYELDGRNLEKSGTPPDIYLDVDPNELAAGRDAQLERAISELLARAGGA